MALSGRHVRTKTSTQVIAELDQLLKMGWRGRVFFVCDNFIGHKSKLKNELLPAVICWMESNENPFIFSTEASINLADDNDPPTIFQRQIDFIQKSGIITAMVGLLNAPRLSKLYRRLQKEGRISDKFKGIISGEYSGMLSD
jgi:hypothetical protein